jgi:hypothetical protein
MANESAPSGKDAKKVFKDLDGLDALIDSGDFGAAASALEKGLKRAAALHARLTEADGGVSAAFLLAGLSKELKAVAPAPEGLKSHLKALEAAQEAVDAAVREAYRGFEADKAILAEAKRIEAGLTFASEVVGGLPDPDVDSRKSTQVRNKVRKAVTGLIEMAEGLTDEIGPFRRPSFVFNPAGFDVIAHVMATALMAQPARPLSNLPKEMGSGIYALFYKGDLPFYAALKGGNVPVYVGSASPGYNRDGSPKNDNQSLASRVGEHLSSIQDVETAVARPVCEAATGLERRGNLSVADFEYRILMVSQGWELAAEQYLIRYYRPTWNKETKRPVGTGTLCTGFGKHGDSSGTRGNKRSKWDTLHPGREWAYDDKAKNNDMSPEEIQADIAEHLRRHGRHDLTVASLIGAATGHAEYDEAETADAGDDENGGE